MRRKLFVSLVTTSFAVVASNACLVAQSTFTQFREVKRTPWPTRTPATDTSSVAVGDYNLDGAPDLAFVDFATTNQVYLYKNDGRGGFTDVTASALPTMPATRGWKIAFLRADADPFPDIIVTMSGRNVLLLNQRNGTFKDVSGTNIPQSTYSSYGLDVGDVDGDGDQDIVLGSTSSQNELWLNDGKGVFSDATATNMPVGSLSAWDATLADVDGDKDLDVFFGNSSGKQQQLYINDGKGVFKDETATRMPVLAVSTRQIAVGDVDGDGDVDVFLGNYQQQDMLLINDGKGVFKDETAARLPQWLNGTYGAIMADIDEDKDLDIFVGNYTSPTAPTQALTLLLNDGSGKFTDATATRMPNVNNSVLNMAVADFDRDRDLDVAFANWRGDDGIYFNHEGQLGADAAPKIGTTWNLDVYAQPGYTKLPQAGVVLLGVGELSPRVSTQWGWLGIAPPWFVISGWTVLPTSNGKTTIPLPIPNDTNLQNVKLWWQGFHNHVPTDARLMNVWVETIQ
ncbi:MAG: VCBS repeat-containing protein [Planctomycetes bacterium]|nr:VCBS repeat-containing protein [Planctomycetota bacterium]